jgi:hypothetical protein
MRGVKIIGVTAITAAGLIAAPAANAAAHTVTYTLWVDNPAPNGFSVSYVYSEPVDQQSPSRGGDSNLFLSPGEIWTRETTMDDPTQWAYMVAVYKNANANPVGTHCEIRVDGVVEATGVSVCSIRQLHAGSGPPGTM